AFSLRIPHSSELQRLAGELAFVLRQAVHRRDERNIARALLHVAAGGHPLLRGAHHFGRHFGHLAKRAGGVHGARHDRGDKPIDHAAYADGLASENAGVDGGLRIVADEAADELHARGDALVAIFHLHLAVSVFQVAVAGAGAEVNPTAKITVAEKAVVLLVG